jgi:Arm DNA-binding domain
LDACPACFSDFHGVRGRTPENASVRKKAGVQRVSFSTSPRRFIAPADIRIRQAGGTSKPIELASSDGSHSEVKPNGSKLWRYRYRIAGKENVFAIGEYPKVSLHAARLGHDFRATASTYSHEMGWRGEVIEMQLSHKDKNQTRAAYNHAKYLPERREMMQGWADWLEEIERVLPSRIFRAFRTSVATPASLRCTASSTAISSNGFVDIFTFAKSTPVPSDFTRTFTLYSTTLVTGTTIFMVPSPMACTLVAWFRGSAFELFERVPTTPCGPPRTARDCPLSDVNPTVTDPLRRLVV